LNTPDIDGGTIDGAVIGGNTAAAGTFTDVVAASLDISGNIDVDGTTNLDVVDIDGAVDMASTLAVAGVLTANAGVVVDNFTLDGTTLALSSGTLTLDVAGDIRLDAGGGNIQLIKGGTEFGRFFEAGTNDFYIYNPNSDKDIIVYGNDAGTSFEAVRFDMSAAGAATFNSSVTATGALFSGTSPLDVRMGTDKRIFFSGAIGEIGSVAGFQSLNTAGNALAGFGIRASSIALATSSNTRLLLSDNGAITATPSANGHAVFNEAGVDADFRVESDNDANALFVRGSDGYIGINAGASPPQPLAIGTSAGSGLNYWLGTANVISSGSGIKVSRSTTNDATVGSGLNLSNTSSTNSAVSPLIHFSARSASNTYSTTYAGIWGRKSGSGTDTNWNTGSIEFGTSHSAGISKRMELNYLGGLITTPLGGGHAVFNEGGIDADFRVESDTNSHMLFVDAGSEQVKIGGSSVGTHGKVEVQNADGRHGIGQKSWSAIAGTGHPSRSVDGVMAFNTASAGTQLSIPITSQANQHRPALIELTFLSGEYNTSGNVKAGFVRLAFQSLTSIGSLAEIDKSGNVASVASSGMNILINFTSAYTAGQSDHEGVMCYYRIIHEQPQYVKMWDATLN
jgi:hypothetical protein